MRWNCQKPTAHSPTANSGRVQPAGATGAGARKGSCDSYSPIRLPPRPSSTRRPPEVARTGAMLTSSSPSCARRSVGAGSGHPLERTRQPHRGSMGTHEASF